MKKIEKLFILFLGLILSGTATSQSLKNSNWFIGATHDVTGKGRALNFSAGTFNGVLPSVADQVDNDELTGFWSTSELHHSPLVDSNGVASVSNAAGELLFYTNGIGIWNGDHEPVQKLADYDRTLILPVVGHPGVYYIIGSEKLKNGDTTALMYSIYDITLNDDHGGIVEGHHNEVIRFLPSIRMTSFINPVDGYPYFVTIGPNPDSAAIDIYHFNTFYIYKIEDLTGPKLVSPYVEMEEVVYQSFEARSRTVQYSAGYTEEDIQAKMKVSHDLTKLAMAHDDPIGKFGEFYFFDLSFSAGMVTINNQVNYLSEFDTHTLSRLRPIDIEVSPSGEFVYLSYEWRLGTPEITGFSILQIDIAAFLAGSDDSFSTIYDNNDYTEPPFPLVPELANPHTMRLGIDNKIYVAYGYPNTRNKQMGVINFPDESGLSAGFNPIGVPIQPDFSFQNPTILADQNLPPFVPEIVGQATIVNPNDGEDESSTEKTKFISSEVFQIIGNPVTDVINIQVYNLEENNYVFQLFDITGQLLFEQTGSDVTTSIDMRNYDAGSYFLKYTDGSRRDSKIVVKK